MKDKEKKPIIHLNQKLPEVPGEIRIHPLVNTFKKMVRVGIP